MRKIFNNVLCFISIIICALLSRDSVNMLMTVVSNYESISLQSLGGLPLYLATATFYVVSFLLIDIFANKNFLKIYVLRGTLAVVIFSALGMISSILAGTLIYGNFFGNDVTKAYPFLMLLFHALSLFLSFIVFFKTKTSLKETPYEENKIPMTFKGSMKVFAYITIMIFSFSFLGVFLTLPSMMSDNSWILIPFYIQLAVPAVTFLTYLFYVRFLDINKHRKVMVIASIVLLAYSILSLILTLITYFNNPIVVISLTSPLLQIERLISFPICFLLIYLVSIGLLSSNLIVHIIKNIKKRKK